MTVMDLSLLLANMVVAYASPPELPVRFIDDGDVNARIEWDVGVLSVLVESSVLELIPGQPLASLRVDDVVTVELSSSDAAMMWGTASLVAPTCDRTRNWGDGAFAERLVVTAAVDTPDGPAEVMVLRWRHWRVTNGTLERVEEEAWDALSGSMANDGGREVFPGRAIPAPTPRDAATSAMILDDSASGPDDPGDDSGPEDD